MNIRHPWLRELVLETRKDPAQVLTDLLAECGKFEAVALKVKASYASVSTAMKSYGIRPVKRFRQIADFAADACMTVPEYLQVLADSGKKLTQLADEHGISHQAIIRLMGKHGITREDVRSIEWGGRRDTMHGHCRWFGMSYKDVQYARTEMGYSKLDSLDYAALCAESRMRRAA